MTGTYQNKILVSDIFWLSHRSCLMGKPYNCFEAVLAFYQMFCVANFTQLTRVELMDTPLPTSAVILILKKLLIKYI